MVRTALANMIHEVHATSQPSLELCLLLDTPLTLSTGKHQGRLVATYYVQFRVTNLTSAWFWSQSTQVEHANFTLHRKIPGQESTHGPSQDEETLRSTAPLTIITNITVWIKLQSGNVCISPWSNVHFVFTRSEKWCDGGDGSGVELDW